jgi:membrane protein DedA with SNARE-associated domain
VENEVVFLVKILVVVIGCGVSYDIGKKVGDVIIIGVEK